MVNYCQPSLVKMAKIQYSKENPALFIPIHLSSIKLHVPFSFSAQNLADLKRNHTNNEGL
jgi:hypothetical protein